MSKANDAADVIRKLVRQNEQLVLAAQILDEFGSFENAVQEAKKALSGMHGETEDAKAELAKAKAELAKAKRDAANVLAEAESSAGNSRIAASYRNTEIIREAGARAAEIEKQAKAAGEVHLGYIAGEASKLTKQRDELRAEVATLTDRADLASKAAEEAEKRLARVKGTIAKMSAA